MENSSIKLLLADKIDSKQYLRELATLLEGKGRLKFQHIRQWAKMHQIPRSEGVYAVFKDNTLCYVGETACLRKRMNDMYDSRNHTIRRTIAQKEFSENVGYIKPTSHNKADEQTEHLINEFMEKLEIVYLEVKLGRTELEEWIMQNHNPIYNVKRKRK